ncbi:unnamed protein product [Caenorhabditis nigoni]
MQRISGAIRRTDGRSTSRESGLDDRRAVESSMYVIAIRVFSMECSLNAALGFALLSQSYFVKCDLLEKAKFQESPYY